MTTWSHKNIIDLASFSIEDFSSVLELASRFKSVTSKGTRKLPALQGKIVTTLFFEPSTRTKNSFELAAKLLSADVQSFTAATSAVAKGETLLDTAMTYIAMGADILIIRHQSTNVPKQIADHLKVIGKGTSVLNAGDGFHSHPSQGLLDLFTLANYFCPNDPSPEALRNKNITIVGDILHSRVARSNLWALTGCGANVILCGPKSLLPNEFIHFVDSPPPGQPQDPIKSRGLIRIERSLKEALKDSDAVMTLRIQKERMHENLITDNNRYYKDYGITHDKLGWCNKSVPVLHPGPVNRGVEISGKIVEDHSISLIEKQVANGVSIRMALLYLLSTNNINND